MKTLLTSLMTVCFALVFTSIAFAQLSGDPCEFDALHAQRLASDPTYYNNTATMEQTLLNFANNYGNQYRTGAMPNLKTIPVVVHVIHNGGPENISDAQVIDAIAQLNEDYRRILGTPGWGTGGVDTEIQFQLATIAPNGNCTNGILHVQSTHTIHVVDGFNGVGTLGLYNTSRWPNDKYLNIYVVQCMVGSYHACNPPGPGEIYGYSWIMNYIAGTIPAYDQHDGIVIKYDRMGRTGAASANTTRTLTHEVGHWLNIYHPFQKGHYNNQPPCQNTNCLQDGDKLCDTPPQTKHFSCATSNTCTTDANSGFTSDQNDLIANYMGYSHGCQNMFTMDQKIRMQGTMWSYRYGLFATSNLIATGTYNWSNLTVGASETWTTSSVPNLGIIGIQNQLTIEAPATLTINSGVNLRFGPQGKIVIKRGAKLVVNGAVLTSGFSGNCSFMWQGIIVEGNAAASQYTAGTQGTVEIKNQSLIENAKEAIRTIRVNSNGSLDYNYTGGIVYVSNSTFRNNRRCAEFLSFHNPFLLINKGYFTDCIFETTAQFKDPTVIPSAFISQWDVRGVKIQGNSFRCYTASGYTGTNRGKGLVSIDAVYDVNRNTVGVGNSFTNLDVGVEFGNSSGVATWTNTVKGNGFFDNRHNIYVSGNGIIPYINQNTINQSTPAVWSPSTFGIYTTGATALTVSCNYITSFTYGSLILGTGTSSDPVSTINDNYYFNNFRTLQTQNSNSKLKINYNDFTPFGNTQMHWYNLGPIPSQGAPGAPAANRFLGNPPASGDIWNSSSANMFIYYYNVPGDANTYPTLNPAGNVLLLNTGVAWTASAWCTTGGGSGLMAGGGSGGEEFSLAESFEAVSGEALNGEESIIADINNYIYSSGLDTNPSGAIEYLETLDNEQADWKLLPYYIMEKKYESASVVLQSLYADNTNEAMKLNYFRAINDAGLDNRNLSQFDSLEVAALDIIAASNSDVRDNARSVLHFFYGREYPIEEIYVSDIPLYFDVPLQEELIIPNVITPNGDGSNDAFVIEHLPEHSSLTIYSSNGTQVFHSDNYENNWPPSGIAAGRYYYALVLSDGTEQNSYFDVVY